MFTIPFPKSKNQLIRSGETRAAISEKNCDHGALLSKSRPFLTNPKPRFFC